MSLNIPSPEILSNHKSYVGFSNNDAYGLMEFDVESEVNKETGMFPGTQGKDMRFSQSYEEMGLIRNHESNHPNNATQASQKQVDEEFGPASPETDTIISQDMIAWMEQHMQNQRSLTNAFSLRVIELSRKRMLKEVEISEVAEKFWETNTDFDKNVKNEDQLQKSLDSALQQLAKERRNSEMLQDIGYQLEEELKMKGRKVKKLRSKYMRKKEDLAQEREEAENELAMLERLKTKNSALIQELEEAHDEIFRLQPYRQDISERQARKEYGKVCDGVETWVEKLLDPIMDNDHIRTGMLGEARKNPQVAHDLTKTLTECEKKALQFQGTEPHVLVALIMNFVVEEVLNKKFAGINAKELQFISLIEQNMQALEPRREPAFIRAWTSEAYYAIINSKDHNRSRENRTTDLASSLSHLLKVFAFDIPFAEFRQSIAKAIVLPAILLGEKLYASQDQFEFRQCQFEDWEQPHAGCVRELKFLDCFDLFKHGKRFDPERFNNVPSPTELLKDLKYLCNPRPALVWRPIKSGDRLSKSELVKKAKVIVAWGAPPDSGEPQSNILAEIIALQANSKKRVWDMAFPKW